MTAKINLTTIDQLGLHSQRIKCELGEFELTFKTPSFDARMLDYAMLQGANQSPKHLATLLAQRAKDTVVGWADMVDQNDQPVPFSYELLVSLMGACQELFEAVRKHLTKLYDLPTDPAYLGN